MAILWLASFPKSGNTWLRAFLGNYLADAVEPMSLQQLEKFGYSDAHGWPYAKLSGRPHGALSEAEIGALRPRVQQMFAGSQPGHVLVKTHNAFGQLAGVPMFNLKLSIGAIYIVRNPWDTAISYADHFGISIDDAITAFARPTLTIEPSEQNVRQFLSSWSGHARSWNNAEGLPLRWLRYENMLANPYEAFGKVVDFLGLPPDPKRLESAIAFSSFQELSSQEAQRGFAEKSQNAERFFRRGKAGAWREVLNRDQVQRLIADHRDALRHFGYLKADDSVAEHV